MQPGAENRPRPRWAARLARPVGAIVVCAVFVYAIFASFAIPVQAPAAATAAQQDILARCAALDKPAGPPPGFHDRSASDRFEDGTEPVLIVNATIWTGARTGTEIVYGDVLLDRGLVKALGYIPPSLVPAHARVVNAGQAWVTPGIVDLHSHAGVMSAPLLGGAFSVSSMAGSVHPWMRTFDGLNTHDEAYQLAIAGGITSAQILPGSGTAIGGQAFFIKLRKTPARTPSSMLLEPPHTLNGSADPAIPPRWRHLKQACGENLNSFGNRLDAIWAFRAAYDEARKIRDAQDAYCRRAQAGLWHLLPPRFPDSLQWEMLVDVLRGRVKISNHCYEAVDLDAIVRLSNEFEFHVASFHHAQEAWLVPDVLKKMWGGPPTVAVFATNYGYKREAYRGSEFAPRVLADNGIPVVLKSDHPVINSRYLLHEAQQAHYYGLPPHLALAAVTSTPAIAAGLNHRIGILQIGADADVVIWDSHPLQIGATPKQVYIDGIPQLDDPIVVPKPRSLQRIPITPNFDKEAKEAFDSEGLPPLKPKKNAQNAVFVNVKEVWTRGGDRGLALTETTFAESAPGVVVVYNGKIVCANVEVVCSTHVADDQPVIDLHGGSIAPGLTTYGSALGLEEIASEPSTGNSMQYVPDLQPLMGPVPEILGDAGATQRAVDALKFGTRNALRAYLAGVTTGIATLNTVAGLTGPTNHIGGLSTAFYTGAGSALSPGAIIQEITALHVSIAHVAPATFFRPPSGWPSVSTQIFMLRRLLLGGEPENTETGLWFGKAAKGEIPLLVDVASADIMATLLQLKAEVEKEMGASMKMSFTGAAEAYLLADEISAAGVSIILTQARPYPWKWDERRFVPGPPLSKDSQISLLLKHNITVAVGVWEGWASRNTRFDISWAYLEAGGAISKAQALALATTNLEAIFGMQGREVADLVAYDGGSVFDLSSKVAAIISPGRGKVDIL